MEVTKDMEVTEDTTLYEGLDSGIMIAEVPKYTSVDIIGQIGAMSKVTIPTWAGGYFGERGPTGYINTSVLSVNPMTALRARLPKKNRDSAAPSDTPTQGVIITRTTDGQNETRLRDTPDQDSAYTEHTVRTGDTVSIIGDNGVTPENYGYYQIRADGGREGWILKMYVKKRLSGGYKKRKYKKRKRKQRSKKRKHTKRKPKKTKSKKTKSKKTRRRRN